MGLPTTFFVKADGTVAKVHVGQLTADQLKEIHEVDPAELSWQLAF